MDILVNCVNHGYGRRMTQTQNVTFQVVGKDRLFDGWTTFTGTRQACEDWAAQRAWVQLDTDSRPVLTVLTS